jgi:hypothetical protein
MASESPGSAMAEEKGNLTICRVGLPGSHTPNEGSIRQTFSCHSYFVWFVSQKISDFDLAKSLA